MSEKAIVWVVEHTEIESEILGVYANEELASLVARATPNAKVIGYGLVEGLPDIEQRLREGKKLYRVGRFPDRPTPHRVIQVNPLTRSTAQDALVPGEDGADLVWAKSTEEAVSLFIEGRQ